MVLNHFYETLIDDILHNHMSVEPVDSGELSGLKCIYADDVYEFLVGEDEYGYILVVGEEGRYYKLVFLSSDLFEKAITLLSCLVSNGDLHTVYEIVDKTVEYISLP